MNLFDYDDGDELSILKYAKQLEGKTFGEILTTFDESDIKKYINTNGNGALGIQDEALDIYEQNISKRNDSAKGNLGNILENCYFGYESNSRQEPDFPKVGIELKQTCLNLKKNGDFSAGERLSITNISYKEAVEIDFNKSHVWSKIHRILLVHYLREKEKDKMNFEIKFVNLFTPPKNDLDIIVEDYNKIISKIEAGKAHELSESDTLYLGACTKGSTAEKSIQPQFYGEHIPAKKRNFCLKRSYMDYVLNNYILTNNVPYESIIKNDNDLKNTTFENLIVSKINRFIGVSDIELCKRFNMAYSNNKAQWSGLTYRILGIKGNQAQEFMKANIVVKAIRLEENGNLKECLSLPTFKFMELISEVWEESALYEYLSSTKFLFVIYQKKETYSELVGTQFWNMPINDLEGEVHKGWDKVISTINEGVKLTKKGEKMFNNLLSKTENKAIHVRPHSKQAAYRLHNGYEQGNIDRDANMLPNGEWMTTQSFWLNNDYILKQLKIFR